MSGGAAEGIRWFHSIDLGGEVTPGVKGAALLKQEADIIFSHPVRDRSFLDVGAWDGYFSFEAEKRGASRVTATDHFCWGGPGWGTQAGFNYARKRLKSRVTDIEIDIPDMSVERVGVHDVVLLSGVLYHVKDPISILERVSKLVGECLIVETLVGLTELTVPAMLFYAASPENVDPTNYWAPNPACVIELLKRSGFPIVKTISHPLVQTTRSFFFATR